MEFFTVPCPGRGKVSINGSYHGENKDGSDLHTFLCVEGLHDITLVCLAGKHCQEPLQRALIADTNLIMPLEVPFECAS